MGHRATRSDQAWCSSVERQGDGGIVQEKLFVRVAVASMRIASCDISLGRALALGEPSLERLDKYLVALAPLLVRPAVPYPATVA